MAKPSTDLSLQVTAAMAATGLLAGTRVLTLEGELPVEFLNPGDRIVTRAGARVLRRITARSLQGAALVSIAAGSLGHDRPDRALTLGAAQPVRISDWRARALFGAAEATVPVARLIDGTYIRRATRPTAQLLTLEFDQAATIYAEGVEVGCPAVTDTAPA